MSRTTLAVITVALLLTNNANLLAQEKTMTTSTGMELIWISPGEFMMGSTQDEKDWARANGASADFVRREGQSKAVIKREFWLGRTEVTVGQWKQFVTATSFVTDAEKKGESRAPQEPVKGACWRDSKSGFIPQDNCPVSCVSWKDAVAFCSWLTDKEKKAGKLPTGMVFRLPTEAEWEYACRAGRKKTKYWWGDAKEDGERRLNWVGRADGFEYVSPVGHYGLRGRNRFGLADMLGNVSEWVLDCYDDKGAHEDPYSGGSPMRVLRGGSYLNSAGTTRCAVRQAIGPDYSFSTLGFRVCCGVPR